MNARGTTCGVDGAHLEANVLELRVGTCPANGGPTAALDGGTNGHVRRGYTDNHSVSSARFDSVASYEGEIPVC